MNNNEQILNNLIGNNGNQSPQNPDAVPTWTDDEVLITTARVVSVRYKVYVVLVALCIFIVRQYLLMPLFDNIQFKKTELNNLEVQMQEMDAKKAQYDQNRALVDQIAELDSQITSCVNEKEWCKELPETLQDNFGIARSYILLWDMYDEKMEINEKKIIENIDSFLLTNFWDVDDSDFESMLSKTQDESEAESWNDTEDNDSQDESDSKGIKNNTKKSNSESSESEDDEMWELENEDSDSESDSEVDSDKATLENFSLWEKNGTINKIVIGDTEQFNDTLYYVPIELSITFDNKDWLLSFINNVEQRVPELQDLRLLYKISKITYDVVDYDQPQETTINMNLYYYEK